MNRRRTVEVMGFDVPAVAGMPGLYRLEHEHVTITATNLFRSQPLISRWALTISTGDHRIAADAASLSAANSKLGDLMLANSYIYRAVKTARRAA